MANTDRVCPSCHLFGSGCQGKGSGEGETCPRYEHRLHWLVRQIEQVRRADSWARAMAAVGAVFLLLSVAAWQTVPERGGIQRTATQAHALASKVITASASGASTSTR